MAFSETKTIHVPTTSSSYDVLVGKGILSSIGEIAQGVAGGSRAAIVSDSNVAPLYLPSVRASLESSGYKTSSIVFSAGERYKTFDTLATILDAVAEAGLTRSDLVVAVGGGVTGDMGGLAAALYLRGIKVLQVPTSLLAMVDASVGGKTAIDISSGKNLVGAFWQPCAVVVDVDCLSTLSPELITDSCGEVIKHAVLADSELFHELCLHPLNNGERTSADLIRIIARNIEIKRDVVVADEREHGLRQTLNLGHTIGHAIEAAQDFSMGHGSCVAIGLCSIVRGAARLGWTSEQLVHDIASCVRAHKLPTSTDIPFKLLWDFAVHDKKRKGDTITVVIPTGIGSVTTRRLSIEEFSALMSAGCTDDGE